MLGMNIKNIKKFSLILIIYLLAGCSSDETTSPYPIIDSGVLAKKTAFDGIHWLDDKRIIFVGKKTYGLKEPFDLLIWDLKEGVSLYKQDVIGICHSQGIIRYITFNRETRERKTFRGPMGKEQQEGPERYFDRINCRSLDTYPGESEGRSRFPLLDEHGYLDTGSHDQIGLYGPILYYKTNTDEPITMSFREEQINPILTRFYVFKGAYYIYGRHDHFDTVVTEYKKHRDIKKIPPLTTWWLYPSGQTEEVKIPPGIWFTGGSVLLRPTKKGIFLVYHGGVKSRRDPGDRGGYLIQGMNVSKVISGYITNPAVSPDGCMVAFSHAWSDEQERLPRGRTLKVINFCNKKESYHD
jgi:hypothetical protein